MLAAVAVLGLCACRDNIPPELDGWKAAREALTSGEYCFAGRKEYCIDDPEFVDAAIKPRLDELYGGEMPPRKVHVDAIIRAAALKYKRTMMRPENSARVEELVKERYLNPVVSEQGDIVSVDMGVVPGHLEGHSGTLTFSIVSSDYAEEGDWKRSELQRVLTTFAEKYPEKKVIRASVTLPWGRDLGSMSYRFLRANNTLVLTNYRGEARTSKRLAAIESLADPQVPVRFFELSPCTVSMMAAGDEDPPKLCSPDVDPAAPSTLVIPASP